MPWSLEKSYCISLFLLFTVLCEIILDERLIVVDVLQAGAAAAIAALAINNKENQDAVVKEGARDDGAVK